VISLGSYMLYMEFWFGIATTGGGLPALCLLSSLGSFTLYIESWVRVATLDVYLTASFAWNNLLCASYGTFCRHLDAPCRFVSCRMASRCSSLLDLELKSALRR
jgi:hypothetical protein